MKRFLLIMSVILAAALTACGQTADPQGEKSSCKESGGQTNVVPDVSVDVDLTKLSSTMVYSQVYDMVNNSSSYRGQKVKMKGSFSVYYDETADHYYFACLIADATACCSQGIEFVLKGDHRYPEDYPELGKEITVTGIFDTYMENGYMYCQLINAALS